MSDVDVLRTAVPSLREQATGDVHTFAPAPRAEAVPRVPLRRRIARATSALHPRGIAGSASAYPLVVLGLLATVGQWDDVAFGLLLPFIKVDMGFDFTFMLTVMSAVGVVTTVLGPLAGYVADRSSRVVMVRVGALVGNVASVLTGVAPVPGALIAARVVGGFGPGIEQPATLPLLADYYPPDKRVRTFTFLQVARVVGPATGLLGVYLTVFVAGVSWRVVLIASGTASLAITALAFRLRDPARGVLDRRAAGASDDEAAIEQTPLSWAETWRTLRSIQSLRRIWYATPFLTVAQTSLISFLFFVVQRRFIQGDVRGPGAGIMKSSFGPFLIIALPPLLSIVALAFAAPAAERMMARKPGRIFVWVGIVLGLQALAMVGLIVLPWLPLAFLSLFIVSALGQMILPGQFTLLAAVIPARVRAQGMQSIAPWQLLGYLLLPVTGGLADAYGVVTGAFILAVVMGAGAFITAAAGADVARDMRAAFAASLATADVEAARRHGVNKMIVVRDLDVSYDGTTVLFRVGLDVDEGECLALLGTNGAGKSTLLRAICGIHEASNGAVFLDGVDVTHAPPHLNARAGVVFLPGGRAIFPTLTVAENLRAGVWMAGDEEAAARIDDVLGHFPELRDKMQRQAGNLSGGEQQMVALAQSFLMRPRLLMIDELSLGLAPAIVERLLQIVREINQRGTTVILVEQSVNVALTIARRAIFMEKGRIAFDGPTASLLARPDLVRAAFLGTGGASFAPGALRRASDRTEERALVVRDVAVSFGGVRALDGVSLDVRAGEIVGIIGPNGAGKTTLFDAISGFVEPDRGSVAIGAIDVTDLDAAARARLGLTRSFQMARLFPSLTVRENIAVALERHLGSRSAAAAAVWAPRARASEQRVHRRVDHLVGVLGLDAYADKFVGELSTGTRRMVDLACVMVSEPRALLLDEPSSGLAQGEIEVLGPVISRLARESGAGIVVIEHDLPLITAMADVLVAMELGRVIATGPPGETIAHPDVMRSYLAASSTVIERSGDVVAAAVAALGTQTGGRP